VAFFIALGLIVALVPLLLRAGRTGNGGGPGLARVESQSARPEEVKGSWSLRSQRLSPGESATQTAEEIVAGKLKRFAQARRELVRRLAKYSKVEVPADVERFFDAVARGNWEEIDAAHKAMLEGSDLVTPRSAELHSIWRAVQETWGIAREAHNWPAQQLLEYGNAVLGSLRPGMIYVGGTDPGCFIPTFLNETTDGEKHMVLTQNGLADGTYLDYLNYLYGDRLTTLTHDDSQQAFQDYLTDAQKRLEHDRQHPDEPKQILPGEDVTIVDNRVQVSGQVSVMAINERLFQMLMEKNPDASFAIEQSFAFKSIYGAATPLGPILELRVQDDQNALSPERARASVDFWQNVSRQLAPDPTGESLENPRLAYAKMAAEQAALLLDRKFTTEAEQMLSLATRIGPGSPEAVMRYVDLLINQNRFTEAVPVAEAAVKAAPDNKRFQQLLDQLKAGKK
jgi:hypothetical protein